MDIKFKLLSEYAKVPTKTTKHAAGYDLYAAIKDPWYLWPFQVNMLPLGIACEIPEGYEGQIRPRSGLSKKGITVALGTVDSDYRGEMLVNMMKFPLLEEFMTGKLKGDPYVIQPGDRIAQLVIASLVPTSMVQVDVLDDSERGSRGFGSSGK